MKKSALYLFMTIAFFYISSCGNKTSINNDDATSVIADYLNEHPEYKTSSFKFGEIKFRGRKDSEDLEKYKDLEKSGYISMNLQEQKKVFLAKDTAFVYLVTLTEKSAPFVLSQGKDKADVKTATYVLDSSKPVDFVRVNDKTAKATVTLKMLASDFYSFDDHKANNEFITKTYKLKLKKDKGWAVSNEK